MKSAMAWQNWARHRIGQCYTGFATQLGRTILDPGIDEIHQLRISIRRLSQALDLCQQRPRKTRRRSFRNLMALVGQLRDCDITSRHFASARLFELEKKSHRKRKEDEKELARFLKSDATRLKLRPEKDQLTISLASLTGKITLLAEDFFKCGAKACPTAASIRQIHKARIAAKKLRYSLELFDPHTAAAEEDPLIELFELQKLLGEIHDLSTVADSLPHEARKHRLNRPLKRQLAKKICSFQRFWLNEILPNKDKLLQKWLECVRLPAAIPSESVPGSSLSLSAK